MNFIPHLRLQNAKSLLKEIVDTVQREGVIPQAPIVRLYVGSQTVSGIPVAIDTSTKDSWVALYSPNDGNRDMETVSYFALDEIKGVTVTDALRALRFVTDRKFTPTTDRKIPSRLTVNLVLKQAVKMLKEVTDKDISVELDWEDPEGTPAAAIYFEAALETIRDFADANRSYDSTVKALAKFKKITVRYVNSGDLVLSAKKTELIFEIGAECDPVNVRSQFGHQFEHKLDKGD